MIQKLRVLGRAGLSFLAMLVCHLPPVLAGEIAALTESLPPISYEVDGKVVGFSSELLDMMAKEAGVTVNKQLLPWARAYEMAKTQPDTMIYSMVRTPEREPLFQWVGPISARRILLYKHVKRTDISLNTLDDARTYRIGTTHESAATKNLIKQGFQISEDLNSGAAGLDIAPNDIVNMQKFVARRFDLLLSLDWAAAYNGKNAGLGADDIEPALILDDSLSYWYGISLATDPDVAKKLSAALQHIKNDGRYLKLKQKYLLKVTR